MKPAGRHPVDALSAVKVRNAKEPGRFADGNGLYLVVDPSGAKRWILRTVVRGKRRDIGLGSTQLVSLSEARDKARDMRKMAREGGDPLAARRAEKAIPSFKEAAETVHGIRAEGWRNAKHGAQWLKTLETYAYPTIGARRVDHVDSADLEAILRPIWLAKPETARRVRQRIGAVMDWATTAGHRTGANPAALVGPGLARQTDKKNQKHHEALPYDEAPAFVSSLRTGAPDIVRLALEWTLLTAARTGETIGATLDEVDLPEAVWNLPPERMKGGKPHRVPLPARCIEIVEQVKDLGAYDYLFPGARRGRPISNMAMLMWMRRAGYTATVHGLRSTFRDWTAEQTSFPRDICEAALAHALKDKVEAAYRRSDLFAKRRDLMNAWAAYIEACGDTVVQLRAAQ
ncbi:MAG: integrase arm-type DNA-binding domain-containing protein [Rhodospirillaceae bacterium]|nr:integrase arm-type DNA-binding domain-containing protein [Rhodospirillaceae bacterium]